MNFKPELAAKVMAGEKTVTRRLLSENPRSPWFMDRCGYRIGQVIAVCPGRGKPRVGEAIVMSVDRMRLGEVDDDEAQREGFTGWGDFYEAWVAINGVYDPEAGVWRIGLQARP